jgi:hypothetical protein
MPPGEFCVYVGAITASDGTICAEDAVAIWSSYDAEAAHDADGRETDAAHDVFIGFLEPLLVMRAVAPAGLRAKLVDYSPTGDTSKALDGMTTLERRVAESLTMTLRGSVALGTGDERCEFDSYRGVFIGLMRNPDAPPARLIGHPMAPSQSSTAPPATESVAAIGRDFVPDLQLTSSTSSK